MTGPDENPERPTPLTRRQLREWEQGDARVRLARSMSAEPTTTVSRGAKAKRRKVKRSKAAARKVSTRTAAARGPRRSLRKRAASKLLTFGAMVFAAAFMVGTTVPAMAIFPDAPSSAVADYAAAELKRAPAAAALPAQTFAASSTALENVTARDAFGVTSYAEMLVAQYGNRSYNYSTTTGAVRWPFPYAVPISSGFGDRAAPCRSCSSHHLGLDFTPGRGAPIYAIADGVVVTSEASQWGYGTHVTISHVINGQNIDSLYAHMQVGTTTMVPGMEVKVGDFVGLVGSTGTATGPHLHFEVRVEGVQVDPFVWLQNNAVN